MKKKLLKNQGGGKYPKNNKKLKDVWIGRNLCRDCLPEYVMKGNIE